MKSVIEFAFVAVTLLLFSDCFIVSAANNGNRNARQNVPPQMPLPPQFQCSAFPGTSDWDKCWSKFNTDMQAYHSHMSDYTQKLDSMSNSTSNDGATSSVYTNGYSIRSMGLSVNSNSYNGQISIDTYIGTEGSVKMTKTGRTMKWEVGNKWISVTPPEDVSLDSIKYETKNKKLYITGAGSGRAASGTSGSSYVSSGNSQSFSFSSN